MAMGLRAWMRTGRRPNPVTSRPAVTAPEGSIICAPFDISEKLDSDVCET